MLFAPPARGRRPAIFDYSIVRSLEQGDIAAMWDSRNAGKAIPTLKTLRHNHHLLAKAVASGKSMQECSNLTGLGTARISVLKADPAFIELVSFYQDELHEVFVDVHARMAALGTSVLEELQERFEEAPDKFTKKELMELFTTVADRSIPSAKGGPKPSQATLGVGPNGGLALQINFVNAGQEAEGQPPVSIPLAPGQSAQQALAAIPQILDQMPAPQASASLDDEDAFMPLGLDGEPEGDAPREQPAPDAIAQARFDAIGEAIAKREAEAAERDRLRAEFYANRRK